MTTLAKHLLHIAIIAILAGIFYAPSLRNDFIWDDDEYVYNNAAVQSSEGLKDIWFSYKMPQYYPMVFTTFWVEHKLWGLDPYGYHAVNLALHIVNAALIYVILLHLYPPFAFAVGLLFALHPVHVETVAWITELKNILGCLFYLLAVLGYVKYLETRQRKHYHFSFVAFIAALLSKSITVTFVVVPLFLKWWRREKFCRSDIVALLPFALVGLASGINTVFLEIYRVGAQGGAWEASFAEHFVLAGQIILFYLYKIAFPGELIFFYPRWQLDAGQLWQWLPLVAVIGIGISLYFAKNRYGRGAFANYLYFVCALFPALGIFSVYPMIFSYVADHFQYIASLHAIVLLVGLMAFLFDRFARRCNWQLGAGGKAVVLYASLGVVSLFFGWKIMEHGKAFANLETLWTDVVTKNDRSWAAHNNLGMVYQKQGKIEKASDEFKKAIEINPEYLLAHQNLGLYYYYSDQGSSAIQEFKKTIDIDPDHADAYNNLGLVYLNLDQIDKAQDYFLTAIAKKPKMIQAHYNLAECYIVKEQYDKSIDELLVSINFHPQYYEAMNRVAQVYEMVGREDLAVYWYKRAVSVKGDYSPAHNNLGNILARRGALREAIDEYQLALQGDPEFVDSLVNLGNAFWLLKQENRAVPYFRRAMELGVDLPPELRRVVEDTNAHGKGSTLLPLKVD